MNISNNKTVLGITNNEVTGEDFVDGKPGQLWKKGKPDTDGYFSIEGSKSSKILTATSPSNLEGLPLEVLGNQVMLNYIIFVYFFIVLLCYQQIANKYGQEGRLLMAFILFQFGMPVQQSF